MKQKLFLTYLVLFLSSTILAKIAWEPSILVSKTGILPKIKVVNSNVSYSFQERHGNELVFYIAPTKKEKLILPAVQDESFIFYDFQQDSHSNIHVLYSTDNTLDEIRIHPPQFVHITNIFQSKNLLSPSLFYNSQYNIYITFYIKYIHNHYSVFARTATETNNQSFWSKEKIFLTDFKHAVQGSFFPIADFINKTMFVVYSKRHGEDLNRYDSIYIKSTTNFGDTWSDEKRLSLHKQNALYPHFTIANKHDMFISFIEEQTNRPKPALILLHSTNKGLSFQRTQFTNFYHTIYFPKIVVIKQELYLFGYDYSKNGKSQLFSKRYNLETKKWEETTYLSNPNYNILNYSLAVDENRVYTIYEDERHYIYYRQNDVTTKPPIVYSSDIHTNYENNIDVFALHWKSVHDISGIQGYSYMLDQNPHTIPDVMNITADITGKTFSYLDDGTYYFHIRAIDGSGNWSPTTTFKFVINTTPIKPPVIVSKTHPAYATSSNNAPVFSWSQNQETRKIAGYSYLLSQDDTLIPKEKILTKKTTKQFNSVKNGTWYFSVRAVDEHNHWSDATQYPFSILYKKPIPITSVKPAKTTKTSNLFVYKVKKGDVLSHIIQKILGLHSQTAYKNYLKDIAHFNTIPDVDYLKPGDKIAFPAIVAKTNTKKDVFAEDIYGTKNKKTKILVINKNQTTSKKSTINEGDLIILKDKYFLRTGKLKSTSESSKKSKNKK